MDKSSKIGENEINIEATERAKKDPKYILFLKWAQENGVIFDNIDFPVAFGPLGVIGASAKTDIPASTVYLNGAFLAIPNKMIMTIEQARESPLKEMFNANPAIFSIDEDAETNIMSVYVLYEKLKGKQSFYFPYLNAINPCSICITWGSEVIAATESNHFIKEAIELIHDMEGMWTTVKFVLDDYPQFFPQDKLSKELFFWCYQAVMTRVFGWGLPMTALIPFGDFINHSDTGSSYHVINVEYEKEDQKDFEYKRFSLEIDLSIFKQDFNVKPEERKQVPSVLKKRQEFVKKYIVLIQECLPQEVQEKVKADDYTREDLKNYITMINLHLMKTQDYRQVWYLTWHDSSESEDNDSDDEFEDWKRYENEQKSEEEVEKARKASKKKHHKKKKVTGDSSNTESTASTNGSKFTEDDLTSLMEKTKTMKQEIVKKMEEEAALNKDLGIQETKPEDPSNQQADDEENDEDDEDEDEDDDDEKEKDKKDKKEGGDESAKKSTEEKKDDDDESDSESEEDFDWFEDADEKDVYYVYYADEEVSYKKGEQIFISYGRRSNHFLMLWYGFALRKNKYDSLNFSMWTDKYALSKVRHPSEWFFREYISCREWNYSKMKWNNQIKNPKLSEEFRSKISRLDERLMAQLRGQLYWSQKEDHRLRKRVYDPSKSLAYEDAIAEYAVELYSTFLKKYKTTIEEDIEILKDPNLDYCYRFAVSFNNLCDSKVTMRLLHKEIAKTQHDLFKILTIILGKLRGGMKMREAYMERIEEFDVSDEAFIINRKKITNYLHLLHTKMMEP